MAPGLNGENAVIHVMLFTSSFSTFDVGMWESGCRAGSWCARRALVTLVLSVLLRGKDEYAWRRCPASVVYRRSIFGVETRTMTFGKAVG